MTLDELRTLLMQLGLEWNAQPKVMLVFYEKADGTIHNMSIGLRGPNRNAEAATVVERAEGLLREYPDMRQATIVGVDHPKEGPTAWIDSCEACQLLHTHRNTLTRWAKRGYLHPHKVGNKVYYDRAEIDAAIRNQAVQDNGHFDTTALPLHQTAPLGTNEHL